jgi:hypothetical protein
MMHRGLELRVRGRLLAVPASLLMALVVAGCADVPPSVTPEPPPDALALILGPLRADTIPVPDALARSAALACRNDGSFKALPADLRLTGVDARGAARLTLMFQGAKAFALCDVTIGGAGAMTVSGATTGTERENADGPLDMRLWGLSGSQRAGEAREESASGAVGGQIRAVDILLADRSTVRATVSAGMFTAWWRTLHAVAIRGYDATGAKVAEQPIAQ